MKANIPLKLLLAAAVATPLVAVLFQDPAGEDAWLTHVDKACTASRYGIRLAAARKVAEGGDAAVPALRAYAKQHGVNALASSLIDTIADRVPADGKSGSELNALLIEWAKDRDFYWRSSALRGVALRMPELLRSTADELTTPNPKFRYGELFAGFQDDAAWQMRTYARLGLLLIGGYASAPEPQPETDPRARVRFARLSLEHLSATRAAELDVQPLLDALADERTFLDDPWGMRLGQEANKALKTWLGDAYPQLGDDAADDKLAAIRAVREAITKKTGTPLDMPTLLRDEPTPTSGVEVLSCKHGDLFVQWTAAGALRFGIAGEQTVQLPDTVWRELSRELTAAAPREDLGVVICDSMRFRMRDPDVNVKVAPESLPTPTTESLKHLAQRLEEAGESGLAAQLRERLGQFAGR
ncbi:MAG: hypothetical protein R3F29_11165 [Planctomycetota bacterium]